MYIVKEWTFKEKEQILDLSNVRMKTSGKWALFSGEKEKGTSGSPLKWLKFVHLTTSVTEESMK